MNCPKCGEEFGLYKRDGLEVCYCKNCKAMWIPFSILQKIAGMLDLKTSIINPAEMEPLRIKEEFRVCPSCNKNMQKVFFNGIIVDTCQDCNGIFFDNGELSKFFNLFLKTKVGVVDNIEFLDKFCKEKNVSEVNKAIEEKTIRKSGEVKSYRVEIQSKEQEKKIFSLNGFLVIFFMIMNLLFVWIFFAIGWHFLSVLIIASIAFCCSGFKLLKPQEAMVLTLFGKYAGSLKGAGFHWINPLAQSVTPFVPISLKARTLESGKQKINDELGNPIEVGIIVIWEVQDTAKAMFNVNDYNTFLSAQSDSALRNIVRTYPYDATEGSGKQTLRGDSQEISEKLKAEIQRNVSVAGLNIIDAKITHLAYAPEIAVAMLQRQQAAAIIDAKRAIVDGAVGMVEMALNKLKSDNIVNLSDDDKAKMINNLLVILCSNKEAQPVLKNDIR